MRLVSETFCLGLAPAVVSAGLFRTISGTEKGTAREIEGERERAECKKASGSAVSVLLKWNGGHERSERGKAATDPRPASGLG